jgi:hypothetical protein
MPHLTLTGPVSVHDIWLAFEPSEWHEGGTHFKAQECFLSSDKSTALIRSLVVERQFPKAFFVRITEREGELTIGLEALATPERTDGVKRLLALFAELIILNEPLERISGGNIREFLKSELQ